MSQYQKRGRGPQKRGEVSPKGTGFPKKGEALPTFARPLPRRGRAWESLEERMRPRNRPGSGRLIFPDGSTLPSERRRSQVVAVFERAVPEAALRRAVIPCK